MTKDNSVLDPKFPYRNKPWLDHQINVLGKSQKQVAKECGVSRSVISLWNNEDSRIKANVRSKDWGKNNKERCKEKDKQRKKIYRSNNREKIIEYARTYNKEYRLRPGVIEKGKRKNKIRHYSIIGKMFEILGNKCAFCGQEDFDVLSIDHKNGDGAKERNGRNGNHKILENLRKRGWPEEEIKSKYQLLCYNCHYAKDRRAFYDLPEDQLAPHQKYIIRSFKEAYNFFGPCDMCKEDKLKYLTIDHIHKDGAERRRNGEKLGAALIAQFRKQGWTESLKETYRILCFNCNCGRNR
jgi:hypothetical protein